MVAEELKLVIKTEAAKAVRDLKKYQTNADAAKKSSTKLTDTLKKLAGPIAIGALVAGTIKLGKEFSRAASAAEEIGSKYKTIFRSMRSEAEAVADAFADSFDLAGSTARQLLGDTADLLTGLGFTQAGALELSEQVNTLAVDLASFTNFSGGAEGASMALTKALLGEAESVKSLGIVINQNTKEYKDSIKYFTEVEGLTLLQAKAYTALKFATEQSGNAIGDYQRTSESTANTFRRLEQNTLKLKIALGKSVNEGITPMASATATLVGNLADWINRNKEINDFLNEFNGMIVDSSIGIDTLSGSLKTLEARLKQAQHAGRGRGIGTDTSELEQEIATLKILIAQRQRSAALDARYADAKKARDTELAAILAKERKATAEKIKDLEALREAYGNTDAGQKAALESSIAYFETFKKGPMVIAVLEDLREQLEEQKDVQEELNIVLEDHMSTLEALSIAAAELRLIEEEEADAAVAAFKKKKEAMEDMAVYVSGPFRDAYSGAFEEMGRILVEGGNAHKAFREAFKETIAGMLDMLGKEMGILAVKALIPISGVFNPVGAGMAFAGAAAAFTAAGAVRALAQGGDFIVPPGYPNDSYPMRVESGERVTVTPAAQAQGGQMIHVTFNLGGRTFYDEISKASENGELIIAPRSVRR